MKIILGLIIVACSGCAMQPLSDGQRAMLFQTMYRPYQPIQVTPLAPVPQTHSSTCYVNGNVANCQGN